MVTVLYIDPQTLFVLQLNTGVLFFSLRQNLPTVKCADLYYTVP